MMMQLTPPTNYSIAKNSRLPLSQTTQLKATEIQRNGNGLTKAEQHHMVSLHHSINALPKVIEKCRFHYVKKGLQAKLERQINELKELKLKYPEWVNFLN
jgi:hypothetical protein